MSRAQADNALRGELLDDGIELSLAELCRACQLPAERIFELVEEGIVEPRGRTPARWRFHALHLRRVRRAQRLQRDLGVNTPGIALALELLEEVESLRARLRHFEPGTC
ncbi:MAG: chaperone modulator CbpM [Gammaproteobacteria bacterium]|nr:chaperone modulator CbpM [Gammaproteobacteria bacterium]